MKKFEAIASFLRMDPVAECNGEPVPTLPRSMRVVCTVAYLRCVMHRTDPLKLDSTEQHKHKSGCGVRRDAARKNRYQVFDAAQDSSLRGRHEDLHLIAHALHDGEFVLH